jgi:hypothetical protein
VHTGKIYSAPLCQCDKQLPNLNAPARNASNLNKYWEIFWNWYKWQWPLKASSFSVTRRSQFKLAEPLLSDIVEIDSGIEVLLQKLW